MDDAALCTRVLDRLVSSALLEINMSRRSAQMTSNDGSLAFMKNVRYLYARHLLKTISVDSNSTIFSNSAES
jgi:hypothetical protein